MITKIKNNIRSRNFSEIFSFCLLIISLIWLKEVNYLFYDTFDSPDFEDYFVYFEHFFNREQTYREHGLMYYYLHSLNFSIFYGDLQNFDIYMHKSVQQVNFYIFIFGYFGYYLLMRLLDFSNQIIFFSLTFINFFPPSISMRLVFKPEILAFATIPWIIYLIEKFKKEEKFYYLLLAIPLLASSLTLKGNITGIICTYLFICYFNIFRNLSRRQFLYLFLLLSISFSVLTAENNSANGKNLLDTQSGSGTEANYDNKAPLSIIYNADLYTLFTSPIKPTQANSFIGITLLETSGDYFDLYWNNDASAYFDNRKEIVKFIQSDKIKAPELNLENPSITIYKQNNTDSYVYETGGLIISLILYFYLIKAYQKNSEYRRFLVFAFIGMILLLLHSITGFPKNNFDPLLGDTFKPLYYSFALIFSFTFLIAINLKQNINKSYLIIAYIVFIIFTLGFPKNYDYELQTDIVPKIERSLFCDVEKSYFLDNSDYENISCKISKENETNEASPLMQGKVIKHAPSNLLFILFNFLISFYLLFERRILKKF